MHTLSHCIHPIYWFLILLLLPLTVQAQTTTLNTGGPVDVELRVMTFNIWVGGELVDFGKIIEAIQAADADIVGLQEPGGNTARIAQALGWQHYSERTHIISRFPIIDPPGSDGHYIYVQVRPGQVIAVANTHLPADPYGPYMLRDGETLDDMLENERELRLTALQPMLDVLTQVAAQGYPVLLTGDFNTPSHLDWTAAQVGVVAHVTTPVMWPVTLALAEAGFVDTYRVAHPDPAVKIGMTWTPGYPVPRLRDNEIVDRIDHIYASSDVEVISSEIVGELNGTDVDIVIDPYPSDHRGVVSTVRLTPAAPPLLSAVKRRVITQGDEIVVYYAALDGEETDRIVIVPAGGVIPTDNLMSLPPMEAEFYGAVTFGSHPLTPGEYAAVLVGAEDAELARSPFWVLAPGAMPAVTTENPVYTLNEPIVVRWENAPGHRYDWIAVYPAGESDLYNYLTFTYTGAVPVGSLTLNDLELEAGDYEVRLMRDDWFVVLASAPFTVTK